MPTRNMYNLRENLRLCFSKLKRSSNIKKISSSSSSSSITTKEYSATHLLTKSPPDHDRKSTETSALFIKNFNSLYNSNDHSSDDQPSQAPPNLNSTNSSPSNSLLSSSSAFSSSSEHDPAAAGSDGRFFFSSPGQSKLIVNDEAISVVFRDGGGNSGIIFAIPTYSTDPYAEFRRSMEEMVAAEGFSDDDAGALSCGDYLHGLLLCYLALNRKNTHKFIFGAFNDLLLSLPPAARALA